ncbi:iron complex outermembrane recepter protein [Luteibacter sp. UNCMF331Sha3.1]|uniref:TonB-dependent receptor n=1 Tax=Luteibacter sp. UNCMF331Sha3.1 TaxID=1502760 RepID=UPI0008B44301|nr:TonB-dependent siderophore receptor [Luteibacter sp. UNCMF331Sha3.1]SEM24272.1 iron complex outermembrane recepter protein [Luteibacter sp. UNCMF331Sha3.1]
MRHSWRYQVMLACLGAGPALAQQTPGKTDLEGYTVEATQPSYRIETVGMGPLGDRSPIDVPYSVQAVNNDLARNQQLQSVREALRLLPSVQGENIRPQTRGLQAGVVQNTRIDGLNIAATTDYPIEQFEQIEVLNGLAGALYGPASPAGTFNYIFKRPTDAPLREFDLRYNSRGSGLAHADVGGRFGTDDRFGYRVNVLDQNGPGYVDGSRLARRLGTVGFDARLGEHTVLENDASYYHYTSRGFPGTFALGRGVVLPSAPDPERVGYGQTWGGDDNITRIVSSRLRTAFNDRWSLRAGVLRESNDRRSTVPTNTLTNDAGAYTTTAATTTYSYDMIVSNMVALNGRVDTGPLTHDILIANNGFYWTRYTPYTTGPVTVGRASLGAPVAFAKPRLPSFARRFRSMNTKQQSVSIGDTIGFGERWSALVAASDSWLHVRNYNRTGATTSSYDAHGISPTGSLMFRLARDQMVYATYGDSLQQGDVAPAGTVNANESLKPYRSKQWEAGYKARVASIDLGAALYRIERPYAFIGADNVFSQRGRQVNRGIELTANGDIGRDVTVFSGVSLLDPRLYRTGSTTTSGKQILGLSRVVYNALLEYRLPWVAGLTLTLDVNHAGKRAGDYPNTYVVKGYTVADVGGRYQTRMGGRPVTFRLAVDNVADRRYWANVTPAGQNGYNAAGSATATLGAPRTVRASVQVDLL